MVSAYNEWLVRTFPGAVYRLEDGSFTLIRRSARRCCARRTCNPERERLTPLTPSYSEQAARGQAIGAHFSPLSSDALEAAALLRGELTLKPHRLWRLPDTIKWNENPFGEVNWVAQFHMLRWLDPLRRRADKGDAAGVDLWVAVVTSWIEANPPGRGRATYSWGDMVEAVRAMIMCFGLPMLTEHRPDAVPAVLASIEQHGRWLEDEKHIRIGNHALQQHQGLLVIGAVLERDDWVELAIKRMTTMLMSAYDEEGVNEEGERSSTTRSTTAGGT